MSIVLPDSGEEYLLEVIVNKIATDGSAGTTGGDRILRLYTNNLTPSDSTVTGDITQATGSGYAAVTLDGDDWTVATLAGVTTAAHPEVTFTFNAAITIYGYYITTETGDLIWLERFTGAPFTFPSGGGELAITPKVSLD